jgi:hypothetical protein
MLANHPLFNELNNAKTAILSVCKRFYMIGRSWGSSSNVFIDSKTHVMLASFECDTG